MAIETLPVDLGDSVTLTMTFSVGGVNTDPTTVSLELKTPAGSTTTYTYAGAQITKTATGIYTKTLGASILSTAGRWYYSWIGTGSAEGAEQGKIIVSARSSAT